MSADLENLWCVIPASGKGTRVGAAKPKQYLELNGVSILQRTLKVFIDLPEISAIVVGIADSDSWWEKLTVSGHEKICMAPGGAERIHTVINGLAQLRSVYDAKDKDWVLVHDAVRPCVESEDIRRLIQTCKISECGGLLGVEVVDTVKRVDEENRVLLTENRRGLWRAMTPQMFRLGMLEGALNNAVSSGELSSDESSAMELAGYHPVMVPGSPLNMKITKASDIILLENYVGK